MRGYSDLCDVRSESGIIASIICDVNLLNFSENLTGKDFTDCTNGVLYDVISSLFKEDIQQIDAFNLAAKIGADEKLKQRFGGEPDIEVLRSIVENAKFLARGTSEEYIMLVNNVMGMAYRRSLYKSLESAQAKILKPGDILQLQKSISDSVEKTTDKYITGCEIERIGDILDDICKRLEEKQANGGGYKFLTIPQLNKYLSMERGEMTTFLAPLKSGKSMMLMNTAYDCIQQGAKVILLDTEMTDELFFQRLLSYLAMVPMQHVRMNMLSVEEKQRIEDAKKKIRGLPLWHKYIPVYNMDSIYGMVKTMKRKYGCDTLFFDYIKPSNGTDAYGTYAELGNLTNMLKNQIAGDLDMCVVSACQASKTGGIADSIRIGQYSSTVIKIKRKTLDEQLSDGEKCGNYRLTVMFNRLGEQDQEDETWTDAMFNGNYCRFSECEQHQQEDIFG